jgi:hypothetical protein
MAVTIPGVMAQKCHSNEISSLLQFRHRIAPPAPEPAAQGVPENMSAKKLKLIGSFAVLLSLALAVSCKGFFVNPTLTSLAIGPTSVPLSPGSSYQMVATGTFNDGSTSNVTSKCLWTSTNQSVAAIGSSSGLVTASSTATTVGTTTIGASDGAIQATTTATVTVCPIVSNLMISASQTSGTSGTPITLKATATIGGTAGTDVSTIVTWNVVNSSALTISGDTGTLGTSGQSTTLTATLCTVVSNPLTISVQ